MGKILVIGIGPGSVADMTIRAKQALEEADVMVGYSTYLDLIRDAFPGKEYLSSGMTREVERCQLVIEQALRGKTVALISSGDSGIYGMAGIMLEVVNRSGAAIALEIIPGVTAASAASALLGAPLGHDFAVISLSDLLTPWEVIDKRLRLAAEGDFVICLYNPKSKNRPAYLGMAREIILHSRSGTTPVGIVRNAGRTDETNWVTTLDRMLEYEVDMLTVVIVGNSGTYIEKGKMITPRGYALPARDHKG
jgi:precorrin-3B C17-methyltransferase